MDPLSCLAIAGVLVQFLDFGTKIIREAHTLYQDGESTIRTMAARDTSDLRDFSARFDEAFRSNAQYNTLSEDEKALQLICLECRNLAGLLAAKLETLNIKEKGRVWKSLGTALSNVWSKGEIQKMEEDLGRYRQAINTRMMGLTNKAVTAIATQQSTRFNTLDIETRQIVVSLLDLKSAIECNVKVQRAALAQLLNRQNAIVRLSEARTVINVYNSTTTSDPDLEHIIQHARSEARFEENKLRSSVMSSILNSLAFPMMIQRFDDVTEAHHDTFNWIFQHPHEDIQGRRWDDFVEWLETGSGLYWISGKAGSGKSTLLKLISRHAQMIEHLSVWKQQFELYTASFYFWSSGTMLQRSQEGMLRSLLYDILLQIPQLIPLFFPTEWAELYLQKLKQPDSKPACSWSLKSLMAAFEILLEQKLVPMRLCLFVDGLDEYSGLNSQIANLFHKAAKSPQVKVCVSSRPLLAFKESFTTQLQLRLEDLTEGDIKNYVVDMLENDESMQKRIHKEPAQMKALVDEIVRSASGVFLWVKLIVLELLKGLENHDRVSQLQERLRLLPTDLEELYEHMVFKVDRIYRVEASRFYQIIAAAAEQDDDWRPTLTLTIKNLFLAEEDDNLVFSTKPGWLSDEETKDGIFQTDLRLRSRCGGLLETQFGKLRETRPDMPISYIHRTVKDYLDGTGIRHILSDRTGGLSARTFNPNIALMRAYLLHLKATEPKSENIHTANELVDAFITHARRADLDLSEPNTELIDELFTTRKNWMHTAGTEERDPEIYGQDTTTLAVRTGLQNYFRVQLTNNLITVDRIILNQALCQPQGRCEHFIAREIISLLLDCGADPNERPIAVSEQRADNQSPWQNTITYLATRFQTLPENKRKVLLLRWHGIIKLLLQHGAKANTVCVGPFEVTRDEKTGERIVEETTMTPKQVVEKIFQKQPLELASLIKLLDLKGARMPPEDDDKRTPAARKWGREKPMIAEGQELTARNDVFVPDNLKRRNVGYFRKGPLSSRKMRQVFNRFAIVKIDNPSSKAIDSSIKGKSPLT